jgi:hypothetical protein
MSTTQPPAGRAPGGGAVAGPARRHLGLALYRRELRPVITTGAELRDKVFSR